MRISIRSPHFSISFVGMRVTVLFAIIAVAFALDNGLALTPPMVSCVFLLSFEGLDAMGAIPLQY